MSIQRGQKATIRDVAKLAKVSRATVTRALDEYKQSSIKPATRDRVVAAAAELRYRPSPMAQQLKARKSRNVCIPLTLSSQDLHNPIGGGAISLGNNDIIAGATSVLLPIGYRVDPFFAVDNEETTRKIVEMYLAGYFDAALFPHLNFVKASEELAREGCIVVGCVPPVKGLPNLIHVPAPRWSMDNMPQAEEVIRQGRTQLLFTYSVPDQLRKNYKSEISSGKLRIEHFSCEVPVEEGGRSRREWVDAIVEAVLSGRVDAVLTQDEFFGWEIFRALHQSGVEVPERVTITGSGDVRHVFKPLPILQLNYAIKGRYLRTLASRFVEELSSQNPAKFIVPPPLNPSRTRLQILSPVEFQTAARAELRRERIQGEVEAEILGRSRSKDS